MMRQVDVLEPDGRPLRRTQEARDGEVLALYVLALTPNAPAGLRRTVLRPDDALPPRGARLALRVQVDPTGLLVREAGVTVELLRAGFRSQVVPGIRLPLHARLLLLLPDQSRVPCALVVHAELERGAAVGVAGSGTRSSRIRYAGDNVWWLITDTKGLVLTFWTDVWDRLRDRMMKMGIDSRVLSFMTGLIVSAAIGGFIAYRQYSAAQEAGERADAAQSALALAQAAQAASLQSQAECLAARQALVAELADSRAQAALSVELALASTLSVDQAIAVGGARYGAAAVRERDQVARPRMVPAVLPRLGQGADISRCLAQRPALGSDLPAWLLAWHPDPAGVCAADFRAEQGTVRLVGPFGLSDRLVRAYGTAGEAATGVSNDALADLVGDPRADLRWASYTLAAAYRAMFEALVDADVRDRVLVLPSQAQVWSLALLHAYNALPSPADGALDQPLPVCVARLIDQRLAEEGGPLDGQPVLPDAVDVLAGDAPFDVVPTGGCGWTTDGVLDGLDAAVRAVARVADAGGSGVPTLAQ